MNEEEIIREVENLIIIFKEVSTDNNYSYKEQISAEEQLKTIQGLLDLYRQEKEKNRQSKMRIVQLEKEIDARIEDVNTYYINKDKIKEKIEEYNKIKEGTIDDDIYDGMVNYIDALNDLLLEEE